MQVGGDAAWVRGGRQWESGEGQKTQEIKVFWRGWTGSAGFKVEGRARRSRLAAVGEARPREGKESGGWTRFGVQGGLRRCYRPGFLVGAGQSGWSAPDWPAGHAGLCP